jgi:hypothetical protein
LREGIRSFSIDAIHHAEILTDKAKDVAKSQLKEVLESGYCSRRPNIDPGCRLNIDPGPVAVF